MSRGLGRRSEIARIIRSEERQLSALLDGLLGDDLGADFGIGGKDTVITQHVKARRRDESRKACDEVQGLEQNGFGAVLPWLLEAVAEASIAVLFESVECQWWASDVAANTLEPFSAYRTYDLGKR